MHHLKKDGLLYLYRTQWGTKLIEKVGQKYKKTLKILSYVCIWTGYILMGWMIWFFMFVLLGMGVYYFLIKSGLSFGFNLSGSKTVPNDDADDDQKENVLPNWVQGLHDRLIKKKKRHQHKVKTKKREEMLTEFGVTQHHPKKRNPHFHKLHRIVRHYEINKKDVSENNKKEQKSFVEHLGNKIKQKEEKINEKIAVNNTKRKNKNSIDNLRTLTRKK